MESMWILISYGAPFIAGVLVTVVSWLVVADKPVDILVVGAVIFYSFPAYVFFIAPCYAFVKAAIQKWQLRFGAAISLMLCLTLVQTVLTGRFLRVQPLGYLYILVVFAIAACIFLLFLFLAKEFFKEKKGNSIE